MGAVFRPAAVIRRHPAKIGRPRPIHPVFGAEYGGPAGPGKTGRTPTRRWRDIPVILDSLTLDPAAFEQRTGWAIKPEGACRDEICVPLPAEVHTTRDVRLIAERLRMPLIHDPMSGLWCLGPEAGGRALTSARAPEVVLPDLDGRPFHLNSLRGRKVLVVAWASW